MYQRNDIKEGMTVRSADGHKLGKVYAVGETEFHIEKGLFFPKDYAVRYSEISDLRNGELILAHGRDSLRIDSDELPYGSDTIAIREGIHPVTHTATSAEFAAGERTGLPFGERPEDLRPPVTRRDVTEQPAMSAAEGTTMVTPTSAEELEARRRTMTDEELENESRRVSDTPGEEGGPKRIGIDPAEFSKRGF